MERSPSWECKIASPGQDIPSILWDSKVHYSLHNSTCPFCSPDESSPCLHIPRVWKPFSYNPLIYSQLFQVYSFLQVSLPPPHNAPNNPCIFVIVISGCKCHMLRRYTQNERERDVYESYRSRLQANNHSEHPVNNDTSLITPSTCFVELVAIIRLTLAS